MRSLVFFVSMLLSISLCQAGETPQWPDFDSLFGHTGDSVPVGQFLKRFNLKLGQAKSEHEIVGPHNSYSVMFRNARVECIVLITKSWRWPEGELVAAYEGKLPFGLQPSDKPADMYRRFGKETGKKGTYIWDYQGHRIMPVFSDKNQNSTVEQVYIWMLYTDKPGPPN